MKIKISDVKNQHQQVLYYLIKWDWFSLKDCINDSMFFKMQSRLSTLENKYGILAERRWLNFTNRFGNSGSYLIYKAIDRKKCIELFNKLKTQT